MNDQFAPRAVTEDQLAWWEESAREFIPHVKIGDRNWPMIVLSLVTEVRKLRAATGLSHGVSVQLPPEPSAVEDVDVPGEVKAILAALNDHLAHTKPRAHDRG